MYLQTTDLLALHDVDLIIHIETNVVVYSEPNWSFRQHFELTHMYAKSNKNIISLKSFHFYPFENLVEKKYGQI